MCGILAGVAVFVIIALGVLAIFEVRIEEKEQPEEKKDDGTNKYAQWFDYRNKLLSNKEHLTQDILNHSEVAKREMLYWLECLGENDPNVAVWFLLNVCEKVEYQNPNVVIAMRKAVKNDTAQMYDFLKDRLYKILHGEKV